MYSVCICSWWWDVHTCIYFVSSVVFVDFLIKSSSQKNYNGSDVMTSLDLSAAFDTVDHDILLQRLYTLYGMNGTVQEWFRSYLTNRQTKVCIASSYSKPRLLKCGVPQGSVLGARLYTMYTRPMADIMSRHNVCYHSYADESQIYIVCNNDEL